MRPVDRGDPPTRPDGSPKLYREYGNLRIDLVSRLGEYCSYCEMPLGVNLAIEHMLSKSWSLNDIDWNNSLLACTNCNSHKRDATTSESSLNNYYWPSADYATDPTNTYDMLAYVRGTRTLASLVTDGLLVLPAARASKPYVSASYDAVWVTVHPTYAGTSAEQRIKNTIVMAGLNDLVPPDADPKVSDRRVASRTRAWDTAAAAATAIGGYVQGYPDPNAAASDPKVVLLVEQARSLAVATGFWSTWLTVFLDGSRPLGAPPVRAWLCCEILVKPFPGTAARLAFAGLTACP